ncbi:MAG: diadenylate cyclase CdaA [Lachnospiraceae bacterium]|jgi:diadenylate cyclase
MSELLNAIRLNLPPVFHITYIIEILIFAFIFYELLIWVKDTRAWTLLKGIIIIVVFALVAYFLNLSTVTWLLSKTATMLVTILVVVFQPELRRALENLGSKSIFAKMFGTVDSRSDSDRKSADRVQGEIARAAFEMGRARTGALIVMENVVQLNEYERTGIPIDAIVSSQLLINIFEHNTPLHDGAVFISNGRVVAATCYLPLTENTSISKDLGTRHRAGVGISEVSDSLTIIVSEETGEVSLAEAGRLTRNVSKEELLRRMKALSGYKAAAGDKGKSRKDSK